MDFVRRYLPGQQNGSQHKYAPLGHAAQQRPLWQRKHSLLVVMLVLLAGMAFVLATR